MDIAEKDNVRFAIIGSGHIGKRHAAMVQADPEAELAAMMDVRSREETGADAFEVPYFQSLEELLDADVPFDVATICTPNGLHAEQSLKALEARKHVVCEKPMALTKADCEQVIFKALQVSRHVFCVMQNRYSPPSVWLKEVMDQGLLGDILMVQVNCYWNRDERYYGTNGDNAGWKGTEDLDGGTLFTQFSHFIDIMYWLFGDIRDIQGQFRDFKHQENTDFEDSGIVQFEFVNGGMGAVHYSTAVWDKNLESSMTIIGSKGSIKVGGQYMNKVEYCHIQDYEMPELESSAPPNEYGGYTGSAANHHYIIRNVVDTLKGRTSATTNALEGLKVVDIIERIYTVRNNGSIDR